MTAPGSRRDRILAACGTKPGSAEDYPFGDGAAVFKVAGRMFALVSLGPGYHLNKRHWNTVELDDSVPDEELLDLIDHSYDLVVASLTRAQRHSLPPRP
jgi:predicted DNA-binding protein (MmcQ/YjbR family)